MHDLFIKMFLISLSMDKVSMSHVISFSRYQTQCVIKLLFRHLKQWLTGKKRGEGQNTRIWISKKPKELFRWNENINFEGLSFGKK